MFFKKKSYQYGKLNLIFFTLSVVTKKLLFSPPKKIMKRERLILVLVLALFTFVSCKKSVIFEEKVIFPNANWAFEYKAIPFKVPLTASEKPCAVIVELDLVGVPNVEMFYAAFSMTTPKGGRTSKSLIFNFKVPKEPYIIKNSNEKTYRLTVYPKKYFSETGTYTFEVNQLSNKADNYGIQSLRLKIERVNE